MRPPRRVAIAKTRNALYNILSVSEKDTVAGQDPRATVRRNPDEV